MSDAFEHPERRLSSRTLLSADELARLEQFKFAADRDRFLLTRVLVRVLLSGHVGLPPKALTFTSNEWGKPALSSPAAPLLRFNVSHTLGAIVCAVTLGCEIGVDVERMDRAVNASGIAARVFAQAEIAALNALPPASAARQFIAHWTLKEAYAKGRGLGLALSFDSFSIDRPNGRKANLKIDPRFDDGHCWQLWHAAIGKRHRVACAVQSERPFVIRKIAVTPSELLQALD